MENATKALLIAGGMIITVMLLTLLVFGYNRLASNYESENEFLTNEQLDKFNKQFQNYSEKVIRGNELISLMNKVIDYNATKAYDTEIQYKRIKVKIVIGNHKDEFLYENNINESGIINTDKFGNITNTTTDGTNDWESDKKLVAIASTPDNLIKNSGINNLTDTQLQKLTMEIAYIFIADNDDNITATNENEKAQIKAKQKENRRVRAVLLKNILKLKIGQDGNLDSNISYDLILDNDYIATQGQEKINKIKNIVSQYYQYTQFKRALFKCDKVKIDTETGRVVEMNFEVQTKNGTVQFD